jgi:hypothetical protein
MNDLALVADNFYGSTNLHFKTSIPNSARMAAVALTYNLEPTTWNFPAICTGTRYGLGSSHTGSTQSRPGRRGGS